MASSKASLAVLLFVATALLHTCYAGNDDPPCQMEDIRFTTAATGQVVGGQPEQAVTVENLCSCPQRGVVVYCSPEDLATAGPVDSTKLTVVDQDEGLCLVDSGWPMFKDKPVTFTYASNKTLEFTLYNATPECRS